MVDFEAEGLRVIVEENLSSDVTNIGPVVERVVGHLRTHASVQGDEDDVDLALREAVTNAVVHGNERDPRKLVNIVLASDEADGLFLIVRDSGRGFDQSRVSSPLSGPGIYAPNGRGVFLMRELTKAVTFRDNGREVRMRIR
jgi:serine/threonine-protein kinase RsbW